MGAKNLSKAGKIWLAYLVSGLPRTWSCPWASVHSIAYTVHASVAHTIRPAHIALFSSLVPMTEAYSAYSAGPSVIPIGKNLSRWPMDSTQALDRWVSFLDGALGVAVGPPPGFTFLPVACWDQFSGYKQTILFSAVTEPKRRGLSKTLASKKHPNAAKCDLSHTGYVLSVMDQTGIDCIIVTC